MIRRNYAKTFQGFKTRILTKITALIMIQFINKFDFNRPINNLKSRNHLISTTDSTYLYSLLHGNEFVW